MSLTSNMRTTGKVDSRFTPAAMATTLRVLAGWSPRTGFAGRDARIAQLKSSLAAL
jgi:hypothetical protein